MKRREEKYLREGEEEEQTKESNSDVSLHDHAVGMAVESGVVGIEVDGEVHAFFEERGAVEVTYLVCHQVGARIDQN